MILDLARAGELELLVSPGILEEIARVLQYPKLQRRHRMTSRELGAFLKDFTEFATAVPGESRIEIIKADPDDDKDLACAVEGAARLYNFRRPPSYRFENVSRDLNRKSQRLFGSYWARRYLKGGAG